MSTPRCPHCNGKGAMTPSGYYQCASCCGFFDDKPDEGGTVFADPSKRMERQERYEQQQKDRRIRRKF